jgi:hypothetical protein
MTQREAVALLIDGMDWLAKDTKEPVANRAELCAVILRSIVLGLNLSLVIRAVDPFRDPFTDLMYQEEPKKTVAATRKLLTELAYLATDKRIRVIVPKQKPARKRKKA